MANYSESFTRADVDLNGDSGWIGHSGATAGSGNFAIVSNQARPVLNGGMLSRVIGAQNFPISLTYDAIHSGTGKRYDHTLSIGHSSLVNINGNGITVYLMRSDSGFNNSSLNIYDGSNGTTAIASKSTTFQYDGTTNINVTVTINADGSGSVAIVQGASSDSISWTARTWTNGKGTYFGTIDLNGNDGLGQSNRGGIDTINYTYTGSTVPALMSFGMGS